MTSEEAQQLTAEYCQLEAQLHALVGAGDPVAYNAIIDQLRAFLLHPDVRLEYASVDASSSEFTTESRGGGAPTRQRAVTRRLLKITRYTHPNYPDLFAAYLSSPLPPDLTATDLAICLWWGETEEGEGGIVCRYYWTTVPGRERRWHFQSGDESVAFNQLTPEAQWCFTPPTGDPGQEAEYLSNR